MKCKNEEEARALKEKLDYPDRTVKCPTCGSEIEYIPRGNSVLVKCSGCGCRGGLRGI